MNNWCIYENRNNQTCVTIRFSDCEAIEPVYYRRISENQARRNIDRAARHNINKQNTKLEQSNHEGVTTKKRKILSSPENTRGSDNQKSPIILDLLTRQFSQSTMIHYTHTMLRWKTNQTRSMLLLK